MSNFDSWVIDNDPWQQQQQEDSEQLFAQHNQGAKEMGRFTAETGGKFQQAPTGNHIARCIALTDLGTQHGQYQGEATVRNQVMVTWELCGEKMSDGRPFTVSSFLTNSLNEKSKLRAFLVSWRGRDFTSDELKKFDLETILGAPCMLNVVENEKGKATVSGVARMPKGVVAPEAQNPLRAFWIAQWDQSAFEAISPGIQRIIEESDEYKHRKSGPADIESDVPWAKDDELEDVPF